MAIICPMNTFITHRSCFFCCHVLLSSAYLISKFTLFCLKIVYKYHLKERSGSVVVLDSRPRGRGFEPHQHHCVVSLSKNINPSLVLVQPRKTRPFITERLWMGRKESNQTNKQTNTILVSNILERDQAKR